MSTLAICELSQQLINSPILRLPLISLFLYIYISLLRIKSTDQCRFELLLWTCQRTDVVKIHEKEEKCQGMEQRGISPDYSKFCQDLKWWIILVQCIIKLVVRLFPSCCGRNENQYGSARDLSCFMCSQLEIIVFPMRRKQCSRIVCHKEYLGIQNSLWKISTY